MKYESEIENKRKSIVDYLKDKNMFNAIDDILIEELLFNLYMIKQAKEDILHNGIKENITKNPKKEPFWIKNRSVDIYQQSVKNITNLLAKLVSSPQDRAKLKVLLEKNDDGFDKLFSKK